MMRKSLQLIAITFCMMCVAGCLGDDEEPPRRVDFRVVSTAPLLDVEHRLVIRHNYSLAELNVTAIPDVDFTSELLIAVGVPATTACRKVALHEVLAHDGYAVVVIEHAELLPCVPTDNTVGGVYALQRLDDVVFRERFR